MTLKLMFMMKQRIIAFASVVRRFQRLWVWDELLSVISWMVTPQLASLHKTAWYWQLLGEVVKKLTFYSQAERSRRGVLTNAKFLTHFFHWNLILWYSKHILARREGSQKCIFHVLWVFAVPTFFDRAATSRKVELGILVVGQKCLVNL